MANLRAGNVHSVVHQTAKDGRVKAEDLVVEVTAVEGYVKAPVLELTAVEQFHVHAGVEDAAVVSAVAGTSGIGAAEYDADNDETLADGILQAILNVKGNSAYEASIVLVNPADLYALMSAKDANKQYIGGGYFTGAYGNGSYSVPSTIWGVPVVADSGITSGEALVAAREAIKVWRKGTGVDVRLFEQNEDDAIHNRVTLVGEERLACAVTDLKGVVAVAAKE
jgi:HK97 family phage major capsid protein